MATNDKRYYDFHWQQRGGTLAKDPYIAEKIDVLIHCIPEDVRVIVDIGCGDGAITNVLPEKYVAIGVDRSQEVLKHLLANAAVVSSAECLPFKDGCADLVLSSELLEHLPDELFLKAISEIKRISSKYVLIAVPNEEKLRKRYTKCNACGFELHIYCHLRTFSLSKLARYFNGHTIKYFTFCGELEGKSLDIISYLKNKLANSYFFVREESVLCPNCGNVLNFSFKRMFAQRLLSFSLSKLQNIFNLSLNRKPEPYWLLVLFEKVEE